MRKLATIARINRIFPHPNADNLELAQIRGWQVCIKKGEFHEKPIGCPSGLCVYVEIDSVLPERPEFEFLRERKFRIKTIRLRGELSQGIAFPLSILPDGTEWIEGLDVTEALGITLYQPPIPACLGGDVVGTFPSFIPKTDCERIQNHQWILEELADMEWGVTEKLDGCFERNAYLPLWDGGSITMGEIVLHGKRPTLIGMDSTGKLIPCEITDVFRNGKKDNWIDVFYNPVHKANHAGKSGRMRVTKNHKIFLSSGKEVFAGDLKISDKLISYEESPDKNCLHYIESSLLGCGSICPKLGKNNKYQESHKSDHGEFCNYIEQILGECFASQRTVISGYGTNMTQVASRTYKEMDRLRLKWYPNGKKSLPENLNWIDDFSFAKLYMDDGYIAHSELQNDRANIATNGFTKSEVERLAAKLEEMYGVLTSIQESRGYCSIRINYRKGSIDNFWNAIARHIHPVFKYKLPEKYRSTEFTPYISCKKEKNPVYVDVTRIKEIPPIEDNFPSGRTGFDLETTTHNYICGGLLVHNSSCTVWWEDDVLHVCSRNWELKPDDRNAFWQVANRENLVDKLCGMPIALQGELLGPKIQGNAYKINKPTLFFFDAYDFKQNRYLDFLEFRELCDHLDLEVVPMIAYRARLKSIDTLLAEADADSQLRNSCPREGLVWRPLHERYDSRIGRVAFKAISNRFLLKVKD